MSEINKQQNHLIQPNYTKRGVRGSAIVETIAGLLILLPIFLLLIDIVSLVITQSVNDDLAKQAARYAALQTSRDQALQVAADYVSKSSFASDSGLITNATIQNGTISFNENQNGMVQVITQVQCNLPVAVPFWGLKSTTFQAQATEPIVALQPTSQQH